MDDLRQLLPDLGVFAGQLPFLDPLVAPDTPAGLFTQWLLGALVAGMREPRAMTVSTAGADGNPTARTLILKGVGADGRRFASDGGSAKARDLVQRPFAALPFYWSPLARQVRVRGPVVAAGEGDSAADFLARGAGARAEALLGRQSQPLADLAERDAAVKESPERLEDEPDLAAPGWTPHTVRPESVEFWQGDRERRHTRLVCVREGEGRRKQLLWP
ncbi:pyridoxal 5'-phosphate synthase [Streptomyces sp. NPDC058469]|uniref:pyridoxine/pyridoxamine 5'-phosphate oxidase n=1 Tax=Streptomyces sp. NPDC058469 TaxID=3346514 RepID=UPI00366056BA